MGKEIDFLEAVKAGDFVTVEKALGRSQCTHSKKFPGLVKQTNLNQQDADGLSVLHHAALAGNCSLMRLLLEHGAKADAKDNKGLRPLHYSAWLGRDEPVELLLHHGSHVNDSALDGSTPLHLACEHGHSEVVQKLLAYEADPSISNAQYKTPFDLACEFGRRRVVELLLGCNMSSQLLSNSQVDITENSRTTCLHLAARNGHVDVLKLLIEFGFNINQQTPQGTCLHEAAKYGKTDVVRLLLSCGTDASRLNSYEETALEIVNKFTATRAAKELKQMLKEASCELLARATKDYSKPADPSHLTFKEGDSIMIVDRYSKKGFWKGYRSLSGSQATHVGFFPSDAVVIIDPRIALHDTSFGASVTAGHLTVTDSQTMADLQVAKSTVDAVENEKIWETNRDSGFSANSSCMGHSFATTEDEYGLQNRLSGQSSESGLSGTSHSPGSCSQASLDNQDDSSLSSPIRKVHELLPHDLLGTYGLLNTWLRSLHLDEFSHLFINAGYDLPTISRMTPEDLTAIGITQPSIRKILTSEIAQLVIPDGIPDFKPGSVREWLDMLHLSEYYELLVQQGYSDFSSVSGIMWEDLEEIGIRKLGHQKKMMLAIERLRKVSSGLLQPSLQNPINETTLTELPSPSDALRLANSRPSSSKVPRSPCSGQLRSASGAVCKHSFSGYTPPVPPTNAVPFTATSVHSSPGNVCSNSNRISCQTCSSIKGQCDYMLQNENSGPTLWMNSPSGITSDKLLSCEQEMSDMNLSCLNWSSSSENSSVAKTKGKRRKIPFTLGNSRKTNVTSYGTLPRGLQQVSSSKQCSGAFRNDLFDWYEAENFPTLSVLNAELSCYNWKQSKPPTSSDDADLCGTVGAKEQGQLRSFKCRHSCDSETKTRRYCGHFDESNINVGTCSQCSKLHSAEPKLSYFGLPPVNSETVQSRPDRQQSYNDPSNVSDLLSSQSLSLASLNSSDSSGTLDSISLPFANDDCGTIKERSGTLASMETSTRMFDDRRGNGQTDAGQSISAVNNKDERKAGQQQENSMWDKDLEGFQNCNSILLNNEAVFDDIDGMLLGLAQELDEMLKYQP